MPNISFNTNHFYTNQPFCKIRCRYLVHSKRSTLYSPFQYVAYVLSYFRNTRLRIAKND